MEGLKPSYYQLNREKILAKQRENYRDNREKVLAYQAAWRANHSERLKAIARKSYRKKHPLPNFQTELQRREANRERCRRKRARWKLDPERRAKMSANRARLDRDPLARLIRHLRERIREALSGRRKSKRMMEIVGCSAFEFRRWIQSQWTKGMSWENYGTFWHIDHIVPISYFDLSNPEDLRRAFNWQNMRPLSASQNLRENNRRGIAQAMLAFAARDHEQLQLFP